MTDDQSITEQTVAAWHETHTHTEGTTVLCPECGELMEIRDPRALILTLHLRNECTQTASLFGQGSGE